jgi:hypothetical protein
MDVSRIQKVSALIYTLARRAMKRRRITGSTNKINKNGLKTTHKNQKNN